ncbi:MAG: NADH-quinone oxidoreductase subunit NuoG [Gammaproteobacteria bacterium]|nr:NADH-quinone oxidoreductase subunit NuoG [Gammaproteobacteria bacterium]
MTDTLNLEINGIALQVPQGSMVIEAADAAGITIPRFCYHKKLSIAANCRMCLVEVEKAPKPLPACATPVTDGMKVFTKSVKAIDAQKSVMEFLLINHPLDCPICDQGGECDLQDIAMGFGGDVSRFAEKKRVIREKNIGPLVATDMTRCIHCTRCVRFGQEIAGIREMGATGRGEHTEIGTYVESAIDSEMSGNIIDLCPVGALTSKPYRYSGRPWENRQHHSISPHDCVGSNLIVEERRNHVMRVLPRENEAINEIWLSDRDRFSYSGLYSDDRASSPMIKQGSAWKHVDWETALAYATEGLQRAKQANGTDKIGSIASASSTVEELYLLQKLMRGIGSSNIDHRTRQTDFSDQDIAPIAPSLGQAISDLETVDAALLIGSNIRKDQPIIAHRLRKAALKGAQVMFINSMEHDFNFPVAENIVTGPADMVLELMAVCKALLAISGGQAPDGLSALLADVSSQDSHKAIASHLHSANTASVLIGTQAMSQPEFSTIRALANVITENSKASLGYLPAGANSTGACLAGAVPHRGVAGADTGASGQHVQAMLADNMIGMVLLNLEPEFDCAEPAQALQSLRDSEFVICLTPYVTETMQSYADVILPISTFAETSGTYVNIEGRWQSFAASVKPMGDAKPAWKVLRVLGNMLELGGFEYLSSDEVRDECQSQCENVVLSSRSEWKKPAGPNKTSGGLVRVGQLPIYATDSIVRRSPALQQTGDAIQAAMHLSASTLAGTKLNGADQGVISQNGHQATLPIIIDDRVPDNCVMVPVGVMGSERLGSSYGAIELSKS